MPSPCPACKREFDTSYQRGHHMVLCAQPLTPMPRSKDDCPHHGRLADGRPDPPAGVCGPLCWMIPGNAERQEAS